MPTWTKKQIAYIKKHYNIDMWVPEMAAHFKMTQQQFSDWTKQIRAAGIEIKKYEGHPAGFIATRIEARGNKKALYEKLPNGKWKYLYRIDEEGNHVPRGKPGRKPKFVKAKIKEPHISTYPDGYAPRPALSTTENPDDFRHTSDAEKIAAGYRYVNIDPRTRVLRHPSRLQ